MDEAPAYRLYTNQQVILAGFLGSPLASTWLMRHNFRMLDQPAEGRNCLIIGVVSTVLLLGVAFVVPENFPNAILPIVYLLLIAQWFKRVLEHHVARHLADGGEPSSWGRTVLIGFASLALVFVALFVIVFAAALVFPSILDA